MSKTVVAALVVIYNTACADSATCQSLLSSKGNLRKIVLFDNSTKDFHNRAFCEENGWQYLGGKGNLGLSKAYNAGIDYIRSLGGIDFVCLFDDDTRIDNDYFSSLLSHASDKNAMICVPLIYTGKRLISPSQMSESFQVTCISEEQALSEKAKPFLTAINSGMAIRLSVFDQYRYDENLFLDGIDHKFVSDMRQMGVLLTVFSYRCQHSFSGLEKSSKAVALSRFSHYAADFRYLFKDRKFAYARLVGKRSFHLSLQYHTLRFFPIFFRHLF